MFSRFFDDEVRVRKQVEISSFQQRYFLDAPGWGASPAFCADPQMRLQGWGANLRTNTTNVESDLYGLTRRANRDGVEVNEYSRHAVASDPVAYSESAPFVEESRATHPAWMYRGVAQDRWERPMMEPFAEKGFVDNVQTRIVAKDAFRPRVRAAQLL